MTSVAVREAKDVPLAGGTLLVTIAEHGIGNVLLTDHILEQFRMDHVAAVDSEAFPPIAMVHRGKARFPMRIHADAASRIAVLRSEFAPGAAMARPLAHAILSWAMAKGFARIIALDTVHSDRPPEPGERLPQLFFLASQDATRRQALDAGLREFDEGVLGGVPAVLLLEGRFQGMDVLDLFAEARDPLEGARSVLAFARVLPRFVPKLDLDVRAIDEVLRVLESKVQSLQRQAQRAMEQLQRREEESPLYG